MADEENIQKQKLYDQLTKKVDHTKKVVNEIETIDKTMVEEKMTNIEELIDKFDTINDVQLNHIEKLTKELQKRIELNVTLPPNLKCIEENAKITSDIIKTKLTVTNDILSFLHKSSENKEIDDNTKNMEIQTKKRKEREEQKREEEKQEKEEQEKKERSIGLMIGIMQKTIPVIGTSLLIVWHSIKWAYSLAHFTYQVTKFILLDVAWSSIKSLTRFSANFIFTFSQQFFKLVKNPVKWILDVGKEALTYSWKAFKTIFLTVPITAIKKAIEWTSKGIKWFVKKIEGLFLSLFKPPWLFIIGIPLLFYVIPKLLIKAWGFISKEAKTFWNFLDIKFGLNKKLETLWGFIKTNVNAFWIKFFDKKLVPWLKEDAWQLIKKYSRPFFTALFGEEAVARFMAVSKDLFEWFRTQWKRIVFAFEVVKTIYYTIENYIIPFIQRMWDASKQVVESQKDFFLGRTTMRIFDFDYGSEARSFEETIAGSTKGIESLYNTVFSKNIEQLIQTIPANEKIELLDSGVPEEEINRYLAERAFNRSFTSLNFLMSSLLKTFIQQNFEKYKMITGQDDPFPLDRLKRIYNIFFNLYKNKSLLEDPISRLSVEEISSLWDSYNAIMGGYSKQFLQNLSPSERKQYGNSLVSAMQVDTSQLNKTINIWKAFVVRRKYADREAQEKYRKTDIAKEERMLQTEAKNANIAYIPKSLFLSKKAVDLYSKYSNNAVSGLDETKQEIAKKLLLKLVQIGVSTYSDDVSDFKTRYLIDVLKSYNKKIQFDDKYMKIVMDAIQETKNIYDRTSLNSNIVIPKSYTSDDVNRFELQFGGIITPNYNKPFVIPLNEEGQDYIRTQIKSVVMPEIKIGTEKNKENDITIIEENVSQIESYELYAMDQLSRGILGVGNG